LGIGVGSGKIRE
jgi:hypothetical protein